MAVLPPAWPYVPVNTVVIVVSGKLVRDHALLLHQQFLLVDLSNCTEGVGSEENGVNLCSSPPPKNVFCVRMYVQSFFNSYIHILQEDFVTL